MRAQSLVIGLVLLALTRAAGAQSTFGRDPARSRSPAGLARQFAVGRGLRGRVEVTCTNLLNRTNVAAPATDMTTPATFGKTTSVQTAENAGNRTGQIALRLTF